jgi:hypothetical protein
MCNHCTSDPRDDIIYGSKALDCIRDLVSDVHMGGNGFERTRPAELSELLDIVGQRIHRAAERLQDYVPRDTGTPLR